ncbi:MAG: sugar nucleotide-binding protein [Magnetococcales bacterium]|nr:sugar nucleotide-binding protein [Magnetococcales bacterium]
MDVCSVLPGRVLVFGGSGYIGRALLRAVGQDRALGTFFQNPFPGGRFFDPARMALTALLQDQGDFSHALILLKSNGPVDGFAGDAEGFYRANVTHVIALIEQLFALGIKPIFLSSDTVFDGRTGSYTEEDLPNPLMEYAKQKVAVERHLQQSGHDHVIIRLPKVYGVTRGDGTLFTQWLEALQKGTTLQLAWDQKLSPIVIGDVVRGLLATVTHDLSGLFHLCGPAAFSRVDLFQMLCAALRSRLGDIPEIPVQQCRINDLAFRERRPIDCSMNPGKFVRAVGLQLQTVEESCRVIADSLGVWPPPD